MVESSARAKHEPADPAKKRQYTWLMLGCNLVSSCALTLELLGCVTVPQELMFELFLGIFKAWLEVLYGRLTYDLVAHHMIHVVAMYLVTWLPRGVKYNRVLLSMFYIHVPFFFHHLKKAADPDKTRPDSAIVHFSDTCYLITWVWASALRIRRLFLSGIGALLKGHWLAGFLITSFGVLMSVLDLMWTPWARYRKLASSWLGLDRAPARVDHDKQQ